MKFSNMCVVSSLILLFSAPMATAYASERGTAGFTAMDKKTTGKTATLQQSYVWHDGKRERQIWLDPALLAEFNARKPANQSVVKAAHRNAVLLPTRQRNMRLWYLGEGVSADGAARSLNASAAGAKAIASIESENFSPVLRDSASTAGHMRALPGNIIVYLNPVWDTVTVNAWADKNKLEIIKKLEIGPNIYVIKTAPGLDALNIANTLRQSGEVIAAMPNWWEAVTKR